MAETHPTHLPRHYFNIKILLFLRIQKAGKLDWQDKCQTRAIENV